MSFILGLLTVTAACVPVAEPSGTKLEIASSFMDALNKGDHATMSRYIRPGAMYMMGPGDGLKLEEILNMLPPTARIDVFDMGLNDAGQVTMRTRTNEGVEGKATITLEGGCIVEMASVQ